MGELLAATIKDVAMRARVSTASVSRVLNGSGAVTEPTRQRVLRAAQHLRYTPHEAARSLITRRTRTIGVLLPDIHGEYFSELIRGIDRAARLRGLHLLVSSSHGDADEAALALRAMNGRVDGVLVMSPYLDAQSLDDALPPTLPAVLLNSPENAGRSPAFAIDDFGGAKAMVEHLRALGYQHIAHIAGPERNYESAERLRGFQAALGRSLAARALVLAGNFTEESGYAAGQQLAAMSPRPDAVFAANDMMAIGCMAALAEAGLRVPDDIALAGFDDLDFSTQLDPPLTTVRQGVREQGEEAVRCLFQLIGDPDAMPRRVLLPSELVIRRSTVGGGTRS